MNQVQPVSGLGWLTSPIAHIDVACRMRNGAPVAPNIRSYHCRLHFNSSISLFPCKNTQGWTTFPSLGKLDIKPSAEAKADMGTLGKAIYTVGFWIRETGQALDRLGSRLQGNYYFQEQRKTSIFPVSLILYIY